MRWFTLLILFMSGFPLTVAAVEADSESTPDTEVEESSTDSLYATAMGLLSGLGGSLDDGVDRMVYEALPHWQLGVGTGSVGTADIKDGDGEVSLADLDAHLGHLFHLDRHGAYAGALLLGNVQIDADASLDLPESLISVGAGGGGWYRQRDDLYVGWLAYLGLRGDADALHSGSLRFAAGGGALWTPNKRWKILGGLGLANVSEGVVPVPVIAAFWRPHRDWNISFTPVSSSATWKASPRWSWSCALGFSGGEYELGEDDPDGDAIIYRDVRVGVGVAYRRDLDWNVGIEAGGAFARRFQWLGNDHRSDLELDAAPYIGVHGSWRW